jgi:hypothetical protein
MSQQAKKRPQPTYVRKMHSLWQIHALPRDVGLHMGSISHDDWCGVFEDKRCDCDPEIRLKATVPGCLNEGEPRWLSIDPGGSGG